MEQHEIAKQAVKSYSYLLPIGVYTGKDLVRFIRMACYIDESRQKECDAIEACVLKIKKWNNTFEMKIRRV